MPQGPILDPRGSQKGSKIDRGSQDRHLGAPSWSKKLSKGGSKNEVEKWSEKGSQNECSLNAQTSKKYHKVLQNRCFKGSRKVSKND